MISYEEFRRLHSRYVAKKRLFIVLCVLVTAVAVLVEIGTGTYEMSFSRSIGLFADHLLGVDPVDRQTAFDMGVVWDRVPTALGGIGIGAILGACGCAMQSSMKNPLADPYLTGISSGASLGVALVGVLGISVANGLAYDVTVAVNAFVFSLIPAAVMIFFTLVKRDLSTSGVLLVGIAVMFIFNAMTTVLKFYAPDSTMADLYYWNVGSINPIDWSNYLLVIAAAVVCLIVLQYYARRLNVLTLNDASVQTLGIDPRRIRTVLLAIVSLFTALAVCFTGTIGFVGLVAPHMCRMFLGSDNRYLLPASAMAGAMILLVSDCIAKNLTAGGLPSGVVTALIGGPVFMFLLYKQRRSDWRWHRGR